MRKKIWAWLIFVLLCITVMGVTVSAANVTMKNKKWVSGQGGVYVDTDKDGKKDTYKSYGKSYYKIQIPKQGYIVVDVNTSALPGEKEYYQCMDEEDDGSWDEPDDASIALELLNSKKKLISRYGSLFMEKNKKSMVFTAAVKKGTYYITAEGDQKYKMRYTFTSVPKVSKAGKSLKKAVALKKGVTVKNLLSDNKDHYYKFSLKKKSKVILSFNAKVRDNTMFDGQLVQLRVKKGNSYRVVNSKGKILSSKASDWSQIIGKGKITVTLPKGIYYIRTYAPNKAGGYYTMTWK